MWNYDGSSTGQVCSAYLPVCHVPCAILHSCQSKMCPHRARPTPTASTNPLPGPTASSHHQLSPRPPAALPSPLRLQAPGDDSEVYLVPRAIYKDPFRGGDNILVMCDTYEPPRVLPDGTVTALKPIPTNTRAACAEVRGHHWQRGCLCLGCVKAVSCSRGQTCGFALPGPPLPALGKQHSLCPPSQTAHHLTAQRCLNCPAPVPWPLACR